MTIKILDELERLHTADPDMWDYDGDYHDGLAVTTDLGILVGQALPALIRVARAAERLSKTDDCFRMLLDLEMKEALQQLREMGGEE